MAARTNMMRETWIYDIRVRVRARVRVRVGNTKEKEGAKDD